MDIHDSSCIPGTLMVGQDRTTQASLMYRFQVVRLFAGWVKPEPLAVVGYVSSLLYALITFLLLTYTTSNSRLVNLAFHFTISHFHMPLIIWTILAR